MPHLQTKDERLEYLKRLRDAGEKACRAAYENRQQIGGAVNWRDVHCVGAEYRLDDHGYEYFAVDVEEAAPDADELAKYIAARLKENGFIDVHVQTEW